MLGKEMMFQFEGTKKVGNIRGDFYNGSLCQNWFTVKEFSEPEKKEVQAKINEITDSFKSFEDVEKYCQEPTFKDGTTNYFDQSENFNYWVQLKPIKDDYCIHIYVYNK